MRYLWLVFLSLFIGIGAIFIYQNQAPVSVQFRLDWINIGIGLSRVPVFIPILLALICGILLSAFYLLGYHTYLRLRNSGQKNEIFRLKKLVLLERNKNEQLRLGHHRPLPPQNTTQPDAASAPKNQALPSPENDSSE